MGPAGAGPDDGRGPDAVPLVLVTVAVCTVLAMVALLLRPQTFLDRVVALAIGLLVAAVILVVAALVPPGRAERGGTLRAELDAQRLEVERLRVELAALERRARVDRGGVGTGGREPTVPLGETATGSA